MQPTTEISKRLRVVIVDDHAMIALLLTQIFDSLGRYAVIGHAKNSADAALICKRENPDLIMLDLVLPDSAGLGLLKQLKTLCPAASILVFSGNLSGPLIRSALISGAAGIIGKGASLEEFKAAIQSVSTGNTYLCAQTSETVRQLVKTVAVTPAKVPPLSRREQTVLRHIAAGLSSKEIAAKLGLSFYTISNFRSKLSKKTGLHRAVQLTRYAAQIGLLDEQLESGLPG